MPANAVYVGRPSKWGNPFKVDDWTIHMALAAYEEWLDKQLKQNPHFLDPLKGKDLACWCRLNEPCHADILLEVVGILVKDKSMRRSRSRGLKA